MKKTNRKALSMSLKAVLLTSAMMWASGLTAMAQNTAPDVPKNGNAEPAVMKSDASLNQVFMVNDDQSKTGARQETEGRLPASGELNKNLAPVKESSPDTYDPQRMTFDRKESVSSEKQYELISNQPANENDLFRIFNTETNSGINFLPKVVKRTFIFTGKGSWANAVNWKDNQVPPATLIEGDLVIINGTGYCVFNTESLFSINVSSALQINAGKVLYVSNADNFKVAGGSVINNGELNIASGTLNQPNENGVISNNGKLKISPLAKSKAVVLNNEKTKEAINLTNSNK